MHRRASVLFLGLFAAAAAVQGAAACSNSSSPITSLDSGPGNNTDAPPPSDDAPINTTGCSGPLPVMTVIGPGGTQIPPDWSCYDAGAAFLFRPFSPPVPFDVDGGDGGDASDDAAPFDAGTDSSTLPDSSPPPPDSSAPDSATPPDASTNGYVLQLTDFVSGAAPVGASVSIFWGGSTLAAAGGPAPTASTGTVDDAGLIFFPTPPSGEQLLSYHVTGTGQEPLFWISALIVPPPGRTQSNSLSVASENELVTSVLGSQQPNPNLANIVTGAEDCQYRDVTGGQYTVIDTTTGQPLATGTSPGAPRFVYLQDNLPDTLCTYSTNQGRAVWTMINAPVDTSGRYVLQFSGRMYESQTAPVVLDEYPVETYAGTTSVIRASRLNASPPN